MLFNLSNKQLFDLKSYFSPQKAKQKDIFCVMEP